MPKQENAFVIILSIIMTFIVASMANVYPLSFALAIFRPLLLISVLIFWAMYQPRFVGLGVAFFVGLASDLLLDTELGSQAFSTVVAILALQIARSFTKRLQLSSAWILATLSLIVFRVFLWFLQSFSHNHIGMSGLVSLIISILFFPAIWWLLSLLNDKITHPSFL